MNRTATLGIVVSIFLLPVAHAESLLMNDDLDHAETKVTHEGVTTQWGQRITVDASDEIHVDFVIDEGTLTDVWTTEMHVCWHSGGALPADDECLRVDDPGQAFTATIVAGACTGPKHLTQTVSITVEDVSVERTVQVDGHDPNEAVILKVSNEAPLGVRPPGTWFYQSPVTVLGCP